MHNKVSTNTISTNVVAHMTDCYKAGVPGSNPALRGRKICFVIRSMHRAKQNLNLRIKTEPGADATVYVRRYVYIDGF